MIDSIDIKNFQAHKDLTVDLGPITMFVGPTDAGKSSIIRFFEWVLLNDSSGDFTTWGAKFTKGEITVDGHVVTRKKGQGRNYYSIDAGEPFDAVGRDVPVAVEGLLHVGAVNFQGQLDAHFWLSDTPGEVSKQLNRVVDLGIIDEATSFVASELRDAQAAVRTSQERLDAAKAKRQELKWVEEASEDFRLLSECSVRLSKIQDTVNKTEAVVSRAWDSHRAYLVAEEASVDADELLRTGGRVSSLLELVTKIDSLLANMTAHRKEADALNATASEKEKKLTEQLGGVCPLCLNPLTPPSAKPN